MAVRRIVPDLPAADPATEAPFWEDVIGLEPMMDQGWVRTWGVSGGAQVTALSEGGSGAPSPAVSVEVDDLGAVLARAAAAGIESAYGPATESWGVRRAFLRTPAGHLINVLTHGDS